MKAQLEVNSVPAPPRIAYLTSLYPATSHTFILREVNALREAGVHVSTFSIRAPSAEELTDERIAAEAATTYTILSQPILAIAGSHAKMLLTRPGRYVRGAWQALRHRPPGLRAFFLSLAHFAEAVVLANELKRQGITHLHNHFANSAATVGLLASTMIDLPWSFMIHGISETDYPAGYTLPDKVRAARFVACASWFGRAQAMRVVEPEHWDKIRVVRCGVSLRDVKPSPAVRSGRQIICVGRLSPEKGHTGLLDAFASIRQSIGDVRLKLIGSGPDEAALRNRVDQLRLGDSVEFCGRRSEAETLAAIAVADVLVVSSFMEGLPIVLMEAMALGTPVIAPALAGIPELVDDGRTGLLFTPSKWEDLERALVRMFTDDQLRAQLSANGQDAIAAEFDLSQSTDALAALFASETRPSVAPKIEA